MASTPAGPAGSGRESSGMHLARILVVCLAVAAAGAAGSPARAARTVTGRIEAPTFGSPALPRIVYGATQTNGAVGWVFAATPGRAFTLTVADGPSGLEDFDIAFYGSLDASEPAASHASAAHERGWVPAGAVWGVITLAAGASGTFVYSEA